MKTNIILGAIIGFIILLIVGGVVFFTYELVSINKEIKATFGAIQRLSDTSTTTTPLMIAGGVVAKNNFAALCILSNEPRICQAAGMPVQATPVPQVPSPSPVGTPTK